MSEEIITRLDLIERLARRRERSDLRFRTWVKGHPMKGSELDALVAETAGEVAAQIDCTACGNCCRTSQVVVDDSDIRRLSRALGLDSKELERRYVGRDRDDSKYLKQTPCPFLEGNRCSVYEARPKACRDFPYLQSGDFRQRMRVMIDNSSRCPIVFNTYARLQTRMGFNPQK